jgi:hypothetical protein
MRRKVKTSPLGLLFSSPLHQSRSPQQRSFCDAVANADLAMSRTLRSQSDALRTKLKKIQLKSFSFLLPSYDSSRSPPAA